MTDKKLSDFQDVTIADVAKLVCLYLDQNNAIKNGNMDFQAFNSSLVHIAGTETITGDKTLSGNTVFSGDATFNHNINANITGEAAKAAKDGDGNVISSTYGKLAAANTWSAANTFSDAVALGSSATVTEPAATDSSTKIVNSKWVANHRCKTKATTTSTASVNAPAYVTENYYNSSNGDWYRVWSDGWIEQGGRTDPGGGSTLTVTFLKPFTDTKYDIQKTLASSGTSAAYFAHVSFWSLTTTNAKTRNTSEATYWYACGY